MNSKAGASRRAVVKGIAGTIAGCRAVPPRHRAAAECSDRHAAIGHHQSAAAMGTARAAQHLSRSRRHRHRSVVPRDCASATPRSIASRTGFPWAEGPAWSSEGQYFVFSDVQGNTQYRLLWDDRRVTRVPQAVEQQQRQFVRLPGTPAFDRGFLPPRGALGARRLDDGDRRPVRRQAAEFAERSGAASRRQHLVHRSAVRRHSCRRAIRTKPAVRPIRRVCSIRASARANAGVIGGTKRQLPNAVYRWDPSGKLDQVITEDQLKDPNGICFSPDYKTLYVISTGQGPGDSHSGGTRTHPCVRRAGQQGHATGASSST